jgi:hypothetical protein
MQPLNQTPDCIYWRPQDDLSGYFYRKLCAGIFKNMYLDAPSFLHIYLGPDSLLEQYA